MIISETMLWELVAKYHQLYVHERERPYYLSLLRKKGNLSLETAQETNELVVHYLQDLQQLMNGNSIQPKELAEQIEKSVPLVEHIVDMVESTSAAGLHELLSQLSLHDYYTFDHSVNVCLYSVKLFQELYPLKREYLICMGLGALLHDIGKMRISNDIINKPSSLSAEEFNVIKKHPEMGVELFKQVQSYLVSPIPWDYVVAIIGQHHEHIDGSGYPLGLSGKDIHAFAQICSFADVFDALTTKRSYAQVLSVQDALSLMQKNKGKKFDPAFFDQFAATLSKKKIKESDYKLHDQFDPSTPFRSLELEEEKMPLKLGRVIQK
jgi:putative nucleotidyltransferase with HDIG domain